MPKRRAEGRVSMADLEQVYMLRRQIDRLESKLKTLTVKNVNDNVETSRRTTAHISRLEARLTRVKGLHSYRIHQVYSRLGRMSIRSPIEDELQMKVILLDVGDTRTTCKMVPSTFKLDDRKGALSDISYPADGTDRNLLNILASYRTLTNQSTDFTRHPFRLSEDSTETLLLLLDDFIRQFDGELCFTNKELSYADSLRQTVAGVANLGSVHLVAANYLPTAKFLLKFNLNYDRDLARSRSTMKSFILDLTKTIARLIHCRTDFVRVFSIEKLDNCRSTTEVRLGLTADEPKHTESLARQFKSLVEQSDLRTDKILRFIQSDCSFEWQTLLSYLQISSKDFDVHSNRDYSRASSLDTDRPRLPIGWFCHGIDLRRRYVDDPHYFSAESRCGQWPFGYLGTRPHVAAPVNQRPTTTAPTEEHLNRQRDRRSNIYLSRHCNGGADQFTRPVSISSGDESQTFQLVFQCHVRPSSLKGQLNSTDDERSWLVDRPQDIRPSGLLVKKHSSLLELVSS